MNTLILDAALGTQLAVNGEKLPEWKKSIWSAHALIYKPKAILSFKDFQRHENAIIQKSKILKIQTFTTQHAVHPNFIRDNERGGNLVFLNCESKNILLWGNLLKQVYLRYHQDKTLYHSENFFIPKRKKITLKK